MEDKVTKAVVSLLRDARLLKDVLPETDYVRLKDAEKLVRGVASKIQKRRDVLQKVLDKEAEFRRETSFHSSWGCGRRGLTEIEVDKFKAIVKELNGFLKLLVGEDRK